MRDALSILERCLQDGETNIEEDKIKDLVGIPKLTYIHAIVKAFMEYDVEAAIKAVDEVLKEGKDLNNLLWEMIKYVKDILVYKATGTLTIYSQAELEEIKALADETSKERLLAIIMDLSKLENDMKWSTQKSVLFQVEIIKLCSELSMEVPVMPTTKGGTGSTQGTNKPENNIAGGVTSTAEKEQENKKANRPSFAEEIAKFGEAKGWKNVLDKLKQEGKIMVYSNLLKAKPIELNDMTIGISFPQGINAFGKSILEKPENTNELSKLLSMEYGQEMKIRIVDNVESLPKKEEKKNQIESMANDLDIPIHVIDG